MQVKVKKLSEKAVLPQKAYKYDAGFDLVVSRITTELNEVGELIIVYHTDLCMEIPEGYFGALFSRSSISRKPLSQTNAVGVVDSGYRGEVVAKFRCMVPAVVPTVYKEGERFAQLVILPVPEVEMIEAETLGDGDRDVNGLGSTGDKAFTDNIKESADTPLQQQDSVVDAKDDTTSAEAVESDQAAEPIEGSEEA